MATNFGAMADALYDKAGDIAKANEIVKKLEGEKRDLENSLLGKMVEAGTNIVRGSKATVSISETVRPSIHDFEAFEKFIYRKKALHLFERRVAAVAYREMKESLGNKPIPGIAEFTQQRLNVRKV